MFGLYGNLAGKSADLRLLYDTVLEWRALTGTWPMHHVLAAHRDVVEKRPELPNQLTNAFKASQGYAKDNFNRLMGLYAKQFGVPPKELEAHNDPDDIGRSFSWSISLEEKKTVQTVIDMSLEFGYIKQSYQAKQLIYQSPSIR